MDDVRLHQALFKGRNRMILRTRHLALEINFLMTA
jgi:hypothetical protein